MVCTRGGFIIERHDEISELWGKRIIVLRANLMDSRQSLIPPLEVCAALLELLMLYAKCSAER